MFVAGNAPRQVTAGHTNEPDAEDGKRYRHLLIDGALGGVLRFMNLERTTKGVIGRVVT